MIKTKRFLHLWFSQALSQLTIQIMNFLIIVRIFEATGSTIATSIAYALPAIVLGPFAAALVDLVDRRRVLMLTNLLQAVAVFLYALSDPKYLFLSYGVVLVYALFNQFYVPAEAASLRRVVPKEKLPQANGIFFVTQNVSVVAGFGLAGILNSFIGYKNSFLAAAVMLFFAFISVSLLPRMRVKNNLGKRFEAKLANFFVKIKEGYSFIRGHKDVLFPFLLLIALHVALIIVTTNLPAMAQDLLRISPSYAGFLIAVPAGIGAALGTLTITKVMKKEVRKKSIIEIGLVVMGTAIWATAILLPQLTTPLTRIVASVVLFMAAGASFVAVVVPAQTYIQEKTPDALMGRVFGNFWFLATIATIFPVMFSATISDVLGVRTLLFLLGFLAFLALTISLKEGQKIIENQEYQK